MTFTEHHPDLVLSVRESKQKGEFVLSYELAVGNRQLGLDLKTEPFPPVSIRSDPSAYLTTLFKEVEDLSLVTDELRQQATHRLAGIGLTLSEHLLPEKLRERLWSLHDRNPAPTLFLLSNETWVPWELMKLSDPDEEDNSGEGRFLVEAFAFTRWLVGPPQTLELPLRNLALVVSGDSALPEAKLEHDFIHRLETRVTDVPARFSELIDQLAAGAFDAWHFTGHGLRPNRENPDLLSLQLEMGQQLKASDLREKVRGLGKRRPWIFLNACHTAWSTFTLTGHGGFAKSFLRAGAGAFFGAHWAVADERARYFATECYQQFLAGHPLGDAVRRTRSFYRKKYPGDPTWLAYAVYGHPLAVRNEAASRWSAEGRSPLEISPHGCRTSASSSQHTQNAPSKIVAGTERELSKDIIMSPRKLNGRSQPDLVLIAHHEKKGTDTVLTYQLEVQNPQLGLLHKEFPPHRISKDPTTYFEPIYKDFSKWLQSDTDARLKAQRRLAGIGMTLFKELLPDELRAKLWAYHKSSRQCEEIVRTLQILSNETLIPWELLKFPGSAEGIAGPFLVEAFVLTRWLSGYTQYLDFQLREIALIVARDSELPSTEEEREFILSQRTEGKRSVTEVLARYNAVIDHFAKGKYDGWHFTGHGVSQGENPYRWSLRLDMGDELTAHDLNTEEAQRLGAKRPLVFANACHSARGGQALTGIAGLVRAFLQAGAGAFIGSHWGVTDDRALCFARTFYKQFLNGVPVGEATRTRCARLDVKKSFPGDPTWLAYTVFAHPLATCTTSDEALAYERNVVTVKPATAQVNRCAQGSRRIHGPEEVAVVQEYLRRRDAALELLRQNIGEPNSHALYSEIAAILKSDLPDSELGGKGVVFFFFHT